jgi:hypothetical protein
MLAPIGMIQLGLGTREEGFLGIYVSVSWFEPCSGEKFYPKRSCVWFYVLLGIKLRLLHLGRAGDEVIGSAAEEGWLGFSLVC